MCRIKNDTQALDLSRDREREIVSEDVEVRRFTNMCCLMMIGY